jgi:iron complex transport system permease protein
VSEVRRRQAAFVGLAFLLPVAMAVAIAVGSVSLPLGGVLGSLARHVGLPPLDTAPLSGAGEAILWSVRLPRVLIAALVGGGLAVVGACLQSIFRNPMADAGLLGVSAGAGLGAVLAVHFGWATSVFFALPLAAFAGAMAAVLLVYALAHGSGRPTLHGLILTGLAVSALASAGMSILLVATEEFRVKTVLFWLELAAGFILTGCTLLVLLARPLDVLSLGEVEAASLGLPVHATRLLLFALASLVAGTATAVAGSVPFVGLMAPHALRPQVGPLSRHLLPASFLGGAVLVVFADLAARTLSERLDLPLGSLTAFIGAPYFLLALRSQEGRF